jgi:DHA2 family multidrug resistance protein
MSQAVATEGLPPLRGVALAVTAVAIAAGTFMQVLDTSIANVAIPTISGDLGVSPDQGTWVITFFAMANGVSVPISGWLMGRFGPVRTFVASVVLFTIASFLCGLAWNLPVLILFRLLQGAVSGPMIPGSLALLRGIFPPRQQATAAAVWSLTTMAAPVCGPILGGWISDNLTWSWIFFINVPVGIFCAVGCARGLKGRDTPGRPLKVDGVGLGLLIVWVSALQILLDQGKDADWFSSPAIVVLAIVAAIGFLAWVIWEVTDKHPMVDLSAFRSRNFTVGTIAFCLGYGALFANIVLLPLWLQTQLGYIATWAGIILAPAGVMAVIMSPVSAQVFGRVDTRISATLSLALFAIAFFMRSGLTPDADFAALVLPMWFQGAAMGFFFTSIITLSLADIPVEKTASATGLLTFARITAGGFAASLATTFWDRREALHQTRLAESLGTRPGAATSATDTLHHLGINGGQALAQIGRTAVGQAYASAALDIFWLSGWIVLLLIPLMWLARKAVPAGGQVVAAD